MLAQINGDLIEVVGSGLASGIPVPDALADLPPNRLRFKGGQIIDAASQTTFYVDPDGTKHVVNGAGRKVVQATWDAVLVRDGEAFRIQSEAEALDAVKACLTAEIDAEAERERLKYITPGSGQAAVYLAKGEEAERLLADEDGEPEEYPLLAAEVGITGATLGDVATTILAQKTAWTALAAGIERARLQAKAAIAAGAYREAAQAARDAVEWPKPFGD